MCEANVYLIDRQGNEKLILESVDKVLPVNGTIELENIFSQKKVIKAKIKEMALVEHRIVLEEDIDLHTFFDSKYRYDIVLTIILIQWF
jgi:predicted RNA-binding protein